ncbi:glutamate decarboxylase 1-like [Octopus bimaculoides]|uniref:glutamate decarboxylase 1-like n=1 Tax=Octopus bimaculoides TaxID=37653 RepID=UPI00071CB975|nr:glutamate decarboxylase 1-like [Octopus bimaculoides]|eukprot:XP_014770459.1 PREDICTED: glutamate decarboxylase 1-like [Octopus bimaculoides]
MFRKIVQEVQEMFSHKVHTNSDTRTPHTHGATLNSDSLTHYHGINGPDWSEFEQYFATELFPKEGGAEKSYRFLLQLVHMLFEYISQENLRSNKILDFHLPHELLEIFNSRLYVSAEPHSLDQILKDCRETLVYCVKTAPPLTKNIAWKRIVNYIDLSTSNV